MGYCEVREKNTTFPLLLLFINFLQCEKRGINYLPFETRVVIEEKAGRKEMRERKRRERVRERGGL